CLRRLGRRIQLRDPRLPPANTERRSRTRGWLSLWNSVRERRMVQDDNWPARPTVVRTIFEHQTHAQVINYHWCDTHYFRTRPRHDQQAVRPRLSRANLRTACVALVLRRLRHNSPSIWPQISELPL